ncbi:hypothetical protein X777_01892 [Ooceraea biroi]|uniref:Uncharacterized protein n=1 Tax=Ooceraea biroi TaxID=2015173 RepID=A0A026WR53_OOCBI|nr:hypothetical protein X777_01892 [Ooceraea biroi]
MYRFNSRIIELSLWPRITICCSLSCLATCKLNVSSLFHVTSSKLINCLFMRILLTSFAELPETSIHVFEKKAHEPSMKRM